MSTKIEQEESNWLALCCRGVVDECRRQADIVAQADSFDGLPVITDINWRFFVRCSVIFICMVNDAVSLIPPFPECSIRS
ncbi:hypothetical protein F7287_05990 [Salmonella enterica]|nr:hypothetical protein [Salmonella enterica]